MRSTIAQRTSICLLILCSYLAAPHAVAAESRNCTAAEKARGDKQFWLNKRDQQLSIERHLPWGVPDQGNTYEQQVLAHRDYVIGYSPELRVPLWTAHRLDKKWLGKTKVRVNCFRRDPRINAPFASLPADYKEPVFDQGHLSPNGDMTRALYAVINSFVMSNMSPQFCQFNRGVWQILESIVRLWATDRGTVYVVTGTVFDWDGDGSPDAASAVKRMKSSDGKARVAIPSHMYKIILSQAHDGAVDTLAVMLPNDRTNVDGDNAVKYIADHITTIAQIEAITGLTFFAQAGSSTADAVAAMKSTKPGALWPHTGKPNGSLVSANCLATAALPL
jgi:DNA/RNA endonuclease G (NUC1)